MANAEQLAILKQGVEVWNSWREQNPNTDISLESADLRNTSLEGVNLADANLKGANLSCACMNHANLVRARLQSANLTHAVLNHANLAHAYLEKANLAFASLEEALLPFAHLDDANLSAANLRGTRAEDAEFRRANLSYTTLRKAVLASSDFRHATLVGANMEGANITAANLESANVSLVKFDQHIFLKTLKETGFHPIAFGRRYIDVILDTTVRCKGLHATFCYGSQRLKLFLLDQDYLEEKLETRGGRFWCFLWWLFADCGRSLTRWAGWSCLFALLYACVYYYLGVRHFHLAYMPHSFITALYYSIVTFTTLGFGDISPTSNLSALIVCSEVILGYVMLGGLISIFSGKLSRRSV
jgi:uncharacterized protein YjbI with pentapeptide repeats